MAGERPASRFLFAAGGTAGHIEPALAVADALKELNPVVLAEFIGTEDGLEKRLVPQRGYRLLTIPKVVLPRKISLALIAFPVRVILSIVKSWRLLRGADALIGFGGYVSASAYLAAWIRRVPIVVHEANAKPGWANRLGRHLAHTVAVNFESVGQKWSGAILTGMPIRDSISHLATLSEEAQRTLRESSARNWGFDPERPIIAVFGGSQGSVKINSVISEFLENSNLDCQIIHALGYNNEIPAARPNYRPLPYFDDMAAIYGSADLMVTRSGAMTCAELITVGRRAILVPLDHGNGEQIENAHQLEELGIARSISNDDFSSDWLIKNLPEALTATRNRETKSSPLHGGAADLLAKLLLKAAEK
jgi:UDP-N-acetylglucosamine--N-acetylmuramyl-(pentapeptide) pyrophosphoryl-undecaprenol N-acetylglucosamine transferase